jgi:hypothetical protein
MQIPPAFFVPFIDGLLVKKHRLNHHRQDRIGKYDGICRSSFFAFLTLPQLTHVADDVKAPAGRHLGSKEDAKTTIKPQRDDTRSTNVAPLGLLYPLAVGLLPI